MSNIYLKEPPTHGKVLIHTTMGDIDVELWSRECPVTCRNFIQLCMEEYYNGTYFHRVIKDFLIQGGDPTGSGTGGSSIYGKAFKDEFHSRLRFTHRGQVAMANENKPNSNHSQFFITLGPCQEECFGKNTLFGKVTGNTIFNVLRMGDVQVDENKRPVDGIMIKSIEILADPFEDIIPRIRKESRVTGKDERHQRRTKVKRKAVKNKGLLSFGNDEEESNSLVEPEVASIKSSHDVLQDDKLRKESVVTKIEQDKEEEPSRDNKTSREAKEAFKKRMAENIRKRKEGREVLDHTPAERSSINDKEESTYGTEDSQMYDQVESTKRKQTSESDATEKASDYDELRRQLKATRRAVKVFTGEEKKEYEKSLGERELTSVVEQRRAQYKRRKELHGSREENTLAKLSAFTSSLRKKREEVGDTGDKEPEIESYHGQVLEVDDNEDGDDDAAKDWFTGKLKFKKHIDDEYRASDGRSVNDYAVIDPREEKRTLEEMKRDEIRFGSNRIRR